MLADGDRWYWYRLDAEQQEELAAALQAEEYPTVCRLLNRNHVAPEKVAMCCGLGEAIGRINRAIERGWIAGDTQQ